MGKNLVNAVNLPSSKNFIIWPDNSINKINLINLLGEAYSKGLSGKQEIIAYQKVRDPKLNWDKIDNPQDEDYIDKKRIFSYEQLNSFYKTLEGVTGDYSPEEEKERFNFVMFANEKLGYLNTIGHITYRDVFN